MRPVALCSIRRIESINNCTKLHHPQIRGDLPPVMPMPGGGMTLPRVPALMEFFGRESIFLMGGGLHTASPDLEGNVEAFLRAVGG